jgi:hypothetical protein
MQFHGKEGDYLLGLSLEELKILHRALWNDLKARRQLGLDEEASDLLHDLQTLLQKEAIRKGVDLSLHSNWVAFAGLEQSCSID